MMGEAGDASNLGGRMEAFVGSWQNWGVLSEGGAGEFVLKLLLSSTEQSC